MEPENIHELEELEQLEPSELGTKDYWDKSYATEIKNYKNHGDIGEIWFDESSQIKVINWIQKCGEIDQDAPILDLGKLIEGNDNQCTKIHF